MRSEVATLRAHHDNQSSNLSGSALDVSGSIRSEEDRADSHKQRIELDVVEAMAQAIRMTAGESPGDGMAMLGTPQFARQLLVAQGLLEEMHQRELRAIRDQGFAWRRSLEEQAAEQKSRRAILEELTKSELSSLSLERDELARRLSNGEPEAPQIQLDSQHDVSRTDNRIGSDVGAEAAMTEAAPGLEAGGASRDASCLATMNASLRDTHRSLVQQQQKLEDVTRERDRFQAHLLVALERASNHRHGLRLPSSSDGHSEQPMAATA
jgi:hypothetical protein